MGQQPILVKTTGDTTLRRNRGCADLLIIGVILAIIIFAIMKAFGG
jgi:hypothetical protein